MAINTRAKFIQSAASEKLVMAHVNARVRLYVFDGPTMDIYSKKVDNFVVGLKQDDVALTAVANEASVVEGTFYYDIKTSHLYCRLIGDVAPNTVELIATYRLFYSDKGISCTHNFEDVAEEVFYQGRIVSGPGYKHKIGIDQALTSLIGEGTLHLKNQDGGLDEVFDRYIFENQDVVIYSWSPTLPPSEARVIYRGKTTNKTFDGIDVKFKIKDEIFALLDSPDIEAYTETDNVTESVLGQYKRRVYGRVDGLRCQGVDQIGEGYDLTGTVYVSAGSATLFGSGTLFKTELKQGDKVIVGTQEFEIEDVISHITATLSDEAEYSSGVTTGVVVPTRGSTDRNRKFIAAGHACAEVTKTITNVLQFNRFTVNDTEGLFAGDFIEFTETSERIEIKTVAPGNVIVLQQNMIQKPTVGTTIIRRPIQEVYIKDRRVNSDDFTIINTATECSIVFDDDAEFNLAREKNTVFEATFTNGTALVTVVTAETNVQEILQPGDWIKPNNVLYTTYYRISSIIDNVIRINSTFTDPTVTETIEYVSPEYLNDESIVSVNILGKTVDGTPSGNWITTVAQTQRDLLKDVNISEVNEASFTQGAIDSNQLVSYFIPREFDSKTLPTIKDCVDDLSKSIRSSLTLDNDLLIKFQSLNVYSGSALPVIRDYDVIDWDIKSTNGKTFRKVLTRYRFTDVDLSTLIQGNKFITFESQFVKRYIETNKTDELPVYLYEEFDAKIAGHRHAYYNQLGTATLSITTDLRLENIEIGQVIIADFKRIYKRFGNEAHRKKMMIVIGKTITGERTELILSDLGNTFNTSSFITPNDAPEYSLATDDEKLIYGFITDNQGITENDEDSAGIHLIS